MRICHHQHSDLSCCGLVVVETEPITRSICYHNAFNGQHRYFYLSFPYLVFIILYSVPQRGGFRSLTSYVGARRERLTATTDCIYSCLLPNVEDKWHKVCMGQTDGSTIQELIVNYMACFWNSSFNMDYDGSRNLSITDLGLWQEETKKNPLCWKDRPLILKMPLAEYLKIYVNEDTKILSSELERKSDD